MLKTNDKLFLAAAAGCGVVAAISGALYLKANTPEAIPTIRVLIAARDVAANQKLTARDIIQCELPLIDESLRGITIPASNLDLTIGRTVSLPVTKGVFLTDSLFSEMTIFTIGEGKCGLAISPRMASMIAPGQLVDVYVCPPRPEDIGSGSARPQPQGLQDVLALSGMGALDHAVDAKLVLEGVRILSVGDRLRDPQVTLHNELDDDNSSRRDIMLELSREEVQRLLVDSRDFSLPITLAIRGGHAATRLSAR